MAIVLMGKNESLSKLVLRTADRMESEKDLFDYYSPKTVGYKDKRPGSGLRTVLVHI